MTEMLFAVVDNTFILLHTRQAPSRAEWGAYLDCIKKQRIPLNLMRTLVVTEGGGPDATQRVKLNELLQDQQTRVSVLSDALVVRAIVTALGWFNPEIRVFSSHGIEDAFAHLSIGPDAAARCNQELARLRAELRSSHQSTTTSAP